MNRDLNKCAKCVGIEFDRDGEYFCCLYERCLYANEASTHNVWWSASYGCVTCKIHSNTFYQKFFSIAVNGNIIIVSKYLWTEKDGDDPAMLKRINDAFELIGHKKTEEEVELILNMFERMRK